MPRRSKRPKSGYTAFCFLGVFMNYTKVIPTKYKGYTFRSRLEARWAVYFDLIGITWDYEPEGYVLRNGVWYLPDFYLHQLDTFVEIKPMPVLYGANTTDSRLFVSGKDYREKWFPFSIDHALWVKFGLPNNDSDYLLYGNGGILTDNNYNCEESKIADVFSEQIYMGEYRCEDREMYDKYKGNFIPEKAHYFYPFNDVYLYNDGSRDVVDFRWWVCASWDDKDTYEQEMNIAKSYKFQRI